MITAKQLTIGVMRHDVVGVLSVNEAWFLARGAVMPFVIVKKSITDKVIFFTDDALYGDEALRDRFTTETITLVNGAAGFGKCLSNFKSDWHLITSVTELLELLNKDEPKFKNDYGSEGSFRGKKPLVLKQFEHVYKSCVPNPDLRYANGAYIDPQTRNAFDWFIKGVNSERFGTHRSFVIGTASGVGGVSFSEKPYVHSKYEKAKEEFEKLEKANPDKVFVMYRSVQSTRRKTYKYRDLPEDKISNADGRVYFVIGRDSFRPETQLTCDDGCILERCFSAEDLENRLAIMRQYPQFSDLVPINAMCKALIST